MATYIAKNDDVTTASVKGKEHLSCLLYRMDVNSSIEFNWLSNGTSTENMEGMEKV